MFSVFFIFFWVFFLRFNYIGLALNNFFLFHPLPFFFYLKGIYQITNVFQFCLLWFFLSFKFGPHCYHYNLFCLGLFLFLKKIIIFGFFLSNFIAIFCFFFFCKFFWLIFSQRFHPLKLNILRVKFLDWTQV
jgi:hypothetical protein